MSLTFMVFYNSTDLLSAATKTNAAVRGAETKDVIHYVSNFSANFHVFFSF